MYMEELDRSLEDAAELINRDVNLGVTLEDIDAHVADLKELIRWAMGIGLDLRLLRMVSDTVIDICYDPESCSAAMN